MSEKWDARFCERTNAYLPLNAAAAALARDAWPTAEDLGRALAARAAPVTGGGGMPIRFVRPRAVPGAAAEGYEARIYLRGEVEVRAENWHDLFNALVWMTFPRAKAAVNARHFAAARAQQAARAANRGPARDALTLFDESGLVVACAEPDLLEMVREFAWHELFWGNRARVVESMRFFIFGHALYEKMLSPFRGVTAHGLLLDVDRTFIAEPLEGQLDRVDAAAARRLLDPAAFGSTRALSPVPVLGVPGWHAANEAEAYYRDAGYFRPGRRRA